VLLFRLPWLLGDGSWFKWFYLNPIHDQGCIPIFHSGENIMEIIDVRDAAKLMLHFSNEGMTGIINLPGSVRLSQQSFAETVSSIFSVTQKQYTDVFTGKLEKEATDAFTSNILLNSAYRKDMKEIGFIPIEDSLHDIMQASQ
jgi:nucleoside-diphosphate-sugar epimerase